MQAPLTGEEGATGGQSGSSAASPYRDRAEQAGLSIERVVHVERTSAIDCQPNTVYAVSGRLERDGRITGDVDNVAIVGLGDGVLPVPAGNRDFDVDVEGGPFLWSGIDFDQREPGAWGRFRAAGDGMQLVDAEWRGSGRLADPDPSSGFGGKSGPAISAPATSEDATNTLQNVTNIHGGVLADKHFGDRPIGIWAGSSHKGTLRLIDCEMSQFANNALYASASPGRFEIEGGRYEDNGVCALRIPHGYIKDTVIEHDASRDGLGNANARDHASVGVASEAKKAGANGDPPPDLINVTVRMKNVGKGGAAARAYDIHNSSKWGEIVGCDFHVERGAGDYASDIEIRGGVEAIRNCEFSGSNPHHHSIDNRSGERVTVENCDWDYPNSRQRSKGAPVDWR